MEVKKTMIKSHEIKMRGIAQVLLVGCWQSVVITRSLIKSHLISPN